MLRASQAQRPSPASRTAASLNLCRSQSMCRLDAAHGRAPAGTGGVRVPDWRGLLPRNRRSASRVRLSSIAAVEAQPEPTQRISSPIACCIPRRAGFVTAVAIGAQKPRVLPAARIPPSFSCLADCSQPVLQDISYSSPVPEYCSRE